MLAEDGVNPDSNMLPFIADMEGKTYTFQGDNDNDDDTMQDGEPIPVEIESGGDGGNASSNAGTGPIGHSQKKTDVSSSRVVKKTIALNQMVLME
uniref:Uncharacterized protein n=2 Tax=Brassica oleracea TaxID=3712 RepID=A0A0D3CSR6_BRAOL